jgi:hypothetical protein
MGNEWVILGKTGIQASTLYWLHCLVGANKLDLTSRLEPFDEYSENLEIIATELISAGTIKSESILSQIFYDPNIVHITDFKSVFQFVLTDPFFQESQPYNDINDDVNGGTDGANVMNKSEGDRILVQRVLISPLRYG